MRPLFKRPFYIQAFTIYVIILIPIYITKYGVLNLLYFCDIALLVTLAAFYLDGKDTESRLLSAVLCGMLIPQSLWMVDFVQCVVGSDCGKESLSAYMFDHELPLYIRTLSFFHFWLPFYLIYAISQSGYHPSGWLTWSKIAAVVLVMCYFVSPPPGGSSGSVVRNINYVYGWNDNEIQLPVSRPLWLAFLVTGGPLGLYFPSHIICTCSISLWKRWKAKWKNAQCDL